MLALPRICSKVIISLFDICFDLSCLSCVVVLVLVVSEVLFSEVVFATEMTLISATKYGPCVVAPPLATAPPGVARVGNHCADVSLAHRRAVMLGAAESAVRTK